MAVGRGLIKVMPWFCPRCRWALSAETEQCPDHALYGVREAALLHIDDAPLLGYVLDERFVLVDYLGGGGMGAVYQGRQLSLERVVAIKVMQASLTATREDRKRFEEEARALSLLQSAHSVTLYDYGVVRDGPLARMAYMVLEYVEGETLAHRARAHPLSPEDFAGVLEGVADALDEAHAHGIVHRDLKPANIILSIDHRGNPQVKVIDFGVASFGGRTGLTRTGFSVGTPSYMAPEQFDADESALLDGRVDVYAMGVVAYTVLSGQKPFHSNSVLELARLHRSTAPPPLPGAETGGGLAAIESVVMRALAKAPAARFASMGAFASAFREALSGPWLPAAVVTHEAPVVPALARVVGPVLDAAVRTPTDSFVGVVEVAPERATVRHKFEGDWSASEVVAVGAPPRVRRGYATLAVILVVCGTGGAWVAHWVSREAPQLASAPVVETVAPLEARPEVKLGAPMQLASPLDAGLVAPVTGPVATARLAERGAEAVAPAAPVTGAPEPRQPGGGVDPNASRGAPGAAAKPSEGRRFQRAAAPPADPRATALARDIENDLGRCQCRAARSNLESLRALEGGAALARRYSGKVGGCVVPDVDETCKGGRVVTH